MTRRRDTKLGPVVIDLLRAKDPLLQAVFKNSVPLETEGQVCWIPTVEMALALKFALMGSQNRPEYKRHLDASDFIRMVDVNKSIDLVKLRELGELVYPGGGKELTEKIGQVRAGKKIQL